MGKKTTASFRLSSTQKAEIVEKAEQLGMTFSEYCEIKICGDDIAEVILSNRGQSILSVDDLDEIAHRIRTENLLLLEEVRVGEEIETSESSQDGFSVREDLLTYMELGLEEREKLSQFIEASARVNSLSEEEVVRRMLAYAFNELIPINKFFIYSETRISSLDAETVSSYFDEGVFYMEDEFIKDKIAEVEGIPNEVEIEDL